MSLSRDLWYLLLLKHANMISPMMARAPIDEATVTPMVWFRFKIGSALAATAVSDVAAASVEVAVAGGDEGRLGIDGDSDCVLVMRVDG